MASNEPPEGVSQEDWNVYLKHQRSWGGDVKGEVRYKAKTSPQYHHGKNILNMNRTVFSGE
ncbi:hypothetical protein ACOBV9_18915 (plasmid) [Pseudoalteromonas espejiana]